MRKIQGAAVPFSAALGCRDRVTHKLDPGLGITGSG